MTSLRLAAYIGGGALLVAWFAAAASSPVREIPPAGDPIRPAPTSGSSSIASEVQSQATRLRELIADAPAPEKGHRNPFTFAPARAPRPAAAVKAAVAEAPVATLPVVPPLSLMGIAEETRPDGPHRTAIIGGAADALYMVVDGQQFADRYQVTAIGQDAVELKDLLTGGYRRLALR
ncbi:MAG TPA: hypothetical protein VH458_12475 [Vicinamibacterales bacterium]|jgi:hypothetical protein